MFSNTESWGNYGRTGYSKSGYKTYLFNPKSRRFRLKRYYKNGYQKIVHREVYKKNYGDIPKNYEIHHINKNKYDNRPQNLVALSKREHRQLHKKK
jgi:hypothetical protein